MSDHEIWRQHLQERFDRRNAREGRSSRSHRQPQPSRNHISPFPPHLAMPVMNLTSGAYPMPNASMYGRHPAAAHGHHSRSLSHADAYAPDPRRAPQPVEDAVWDDDFPQILAGLQTAHLGNEQPMPSPNNAPAPRPQYSPSDDGDDEGAVSESYWPDLAPRLRTEADLRDLRIVCGICSNASSHTLVLACGHMLCRSCAARVTECPFCKARFGRKPRCRPECPSASASGPGTPVPRTMAEYLTFPETGASGAACAACREKNVQDGVRTLMQDVINQQDAKVIFVPQGTNVAAAERGLPAGLERVAELQRVFDSVADVVANADFNRKYAGGARGPVLRGFVAAKKRN